MLNGENIVDVQNDRATIFAGYGSGYPNATPTASLNSTTSAN